MNIRPLSDRIIVRPAEEEAVTPGGILLPDGAKEKPLKGEVLAVGPGRTLECGSLSKMGVKAGDHVYYSRYAGQTVNVDGQDFIFMRDEDVVAVIG